MNTVTLNVLNEGKNHSYCFDLNNPAARLAIRAWSRHLPKNSELAELAYPDDEIVIERLGGPYDPATLTRCKNGVIELRYPKRHLYDHDPDIPLSGDSLAKFTAEDNEKARVFSLCYNRICAAGQMLLPECLEGVSVDEVRSRWGALHCAVDESFPMHVVLGEAFGSDIRTLFHEVLEELIAAYAMHRATS